MRENPDFQEQLRRTEVESKLEGINISTLNFINRRFPKDAIAEFIKQALVRVDDPTIAEKVQCEVFDAVDTQNLLEKVAPYVSQNTSGVKKEEEVKEAIRNAIRTFLGRLEISLDLLALVSQLLSSIQDTTELLHIQNAVLHLEDEKDINKWFDEYILQDKKKDGMGDKDESDEEAQQGETEIAPSSEEP
jgi:DNA topoisomerase VI subunit B